MKISMKVDPYCQQQRRGSNDCSVWQYNCGYSRCSLEKRRQTTVGCSKTSIFRAFGRYVFSLGNEANIGRSVI